MSEPIRVLQVFAQMNRGGAETMIMNLYRNIDRTKVQFDFIVHTNKKCAFDDEIISLGGLIYRVPRYTGKNHFIYKSAWIDFFRQHPEYKILHSHVRSTASIYLKIAKKFGLTTIAHSHSTSSGNGVLATIKKILQYPIRYTADYLFACSDEAGKWLFGEKASKKNNYRLIKNAIEVEKYIYNEATRNKIRKSLNLENKFVIGHVGSFTYPKNHKFLIEVFYEVQKQKENAALLLIGDGQLRESIEIQIKKLGIKDKVILTGVVSNVSEYLQAMDIFVFPSLFEGLGIAIIEAQASGLKCLVSDIIPKEAIITDLVISLELKKDAWKKAILENYFQYNRKNKIDEICQNGYCVSKSSQILMDLYSQMYKN